MIQLIQKEVKSKGWWKLVFHFIIITIFFLAWGAWVSASLHGRFFSFFDSGLTIIHWSVPGPSTKNCDAVVNDGETQRHKYKVNPQWPIQSWEANWLVSQRSTTLYCYNWFIALLFWFLFVRNFFGNQIQSIHDDAFKGLSRLYLCKFIERKIVLKTNTFRKKARYVLDSA